MFSCVCRVVFVQHIKVVSYNSGRTLVIFYFIYIYMCIYIHIHTYIHTYGSGIGIYSITAVKGLNYVHGHMFTEPQDLVSHRLKRSATVEQKLNNVT